MLVGGTAGAQILLVLAAPLLTRLYSPEDFGLLAVYASLLALIGVVSSLRYELAIPLPEDDQEAANVLVLCMILVAASTLLTATLVVLLGDAIAAALNVPRLADYFWLLPLGVLANGSYAVFNYWGIRTKRFSTIALTKLRQVAAVLAIQISAYKLGGIALLFGQVAGHGIGTVSLALPALRTESFKLVSAKGITQAVLRYKRFPIFSTWEGFSNTAGVQLPPLFFAIFFSPAAAGLYALANRVLALPASIVGAAIGQVFFSEGAESRRKSEIGKLVRNLHARLAHIGMAPMLVLVIVGPDLFEWTFGPEWRMAGDFGRWMAPWLYLVFVTSPLSTLFAIMEQQVQGLMFQLILLTLRVGAILVGAAIGDLMTTVILFAGVSALCFSGLLFWMANLVGTSAMSIITPTSSAFLIAVLCIVPIGLERVLQQNSPSIMIAAILCSAALIGFRYWQLLREAY